MTKYDQESALSQPFPDIFLVICGSLKEFHELWWLLDGLGKFRRTNLNIRV